MPLPIVFPMPVEASWPLVWLALAMTMTPLWITVRSLTEALARARSAARDLEAQQVQLQDLVGQRTQELSRRTAYLGATTEVARETASAAGDLAQLLQRMAQVIGEQFGLYHVGVFLVDAREPWVELRAASSEGGQRMLARNHRLRLGVGMVGSVAQQGMHRIALDVGQDVAFQANPDLPETRSEMALPLRVRGRVIGVLDVQSTEPASFAQEDVAVLQALADQVSVAIDNARLSVQMQSALEAERSAYGELSRQQWQALLAAEPDLGFVSDAAGTVPAGTLWEPQMETAVESGEVTTSEGNASAVSIPIRVRDQVVGVVDGRKPDGSQWTPEEVDLLQAMTEQLNVALEGARLYRETRRRAAQEQAIGQVTSSIRQSLEIDDVLRTAAEQIRDALGLGKAVVRLAAPEQVLADDSGGSEQE